MMEIIYINKNNTTSRLKKKVESDKNLIKILRPTFILPHPLHEQNTWTECQCIIWSKTIIDNDDLLKT